MLVLLRKPFKSSPSLVVLIDNCELTILDSLAFLEPLVFLEILEVLDFLDLGNGVIVYMAFSMVYRIFHLK